MNATRSGILLFDEEQIPDQGGLPGASITLYERERLFLAGTARTCWPVLKAQSGKA
jgi:hypothetical protein